MLLFQVYVECEAPEPDRSICVQTLYKFAMPSNVRAFRNFDVSAIVLRKGCFMLGAVSTKMLLILNVVAVSLCRVNGSSSYEKMTIHHGFDQRPGILP